MLLQNQKFLDFFLDSKCWLKSQEAELSEYSVSFMNPCSATVYKVGIKKINPKFLFFESLELIFLLMFILCTFRFILHVFGCVDSLFQSLIFVFSTLQYAYVFFPCCSYSILLFCPDMLNYFAGITFKLRA